MPAMRLIYTPGGDVLVPERRHFAQRQLDAWAASDAARAVARPLLGKRAAR